MERTLLLVDDEEDVGAALARLLRHDGYTILRAQSGKEGLDLLAQHHGIGVIVSDQRMPEMTGVEFFSLVKELYPKTVRMVLSGYADLNSVTDAINRGAVYKFLTKPWDNELLRANVLEAFEHGELMQRKAQLSVEIQSANTTLATLSMELAKLVEQRDRQIEQLTYYDPLTNLPNRLLFLDRLNQGVARAQQDNSLLALMFIKLNRSEQIHEFFTPPAGHPLLQTMAGQLEKYAGQGDTLAYFGDHKFGMVLTNIKQKNDANEIAQNILDSINCNSITPGDSAINISAHIGISIYSLDGMDSSDLINKAEIAFCDKYRKFMGA